MKVNGISRVLCLLDGNACAYVRTSHEQEFDAANVRHLSVEDLHYAPETTLAAILDFLRSCASEGARVVVHCGAGRGRTGHVLAVWLVAERGVEPGDVRMKMRDGLTLNREPLEAEQRGNGRLSDVLRWAKAQRR